MLAGGRNAKPPIVGEGIERIAAARRALSTEVEQIGDDVLISARFAEW
jgi:diaminohydroxyphosphoribosylaminopyrimidine deaminase/5-amino-6-(5-phosphoribosylamino)uracil reductase